MANYQAMQLVGAPPDIEQGAADLFQRQQLAKMLLQRGMEPDAMQYTPAGGGQWGAPAQAIKQGLGQQLAKLGQVGLSAYNLKSISDEQKALAEKLKAHNAKEISDYAQSRVVRPENTQGQMYPAGNNPDEVGGMGYQPANTQEQSRMAAVLAATSDNPRLSKIGQMDVQQDYRQEDRAIAASDKLDLIREQARLGQISKAEADARAAELKKDLQNSEQTNQEKIIRLAASLRPAPTTVVAEIMKDGKLLKVDANTGRVIGDAAQAGKGKAMSATAQKELIQTDEEMQGGGAALTSLKQAMKINNDAMGFKGAGIVSTLGTLLPEGIRPAMVDATENLDNILTTGALPQLKQLFGGQPTEGERKVLLEIQGSSSKSPAVREQIYKRAEEAINRRIQFSKEKAKSLRDGTYFSGDGGSDPSNDVRSAADKILSGG